MAKSSKGGSFEREICKLLSRWWTDGVRDDVFWRSSQSGGRATQRKKQGKTTYGSYGDITAVDPIGEPLLKLFTIELKRGRSHGNPWSLLEGAGGRKAQPWEKSVWQAISSHRDAGSESWMLVSRWDRKQSLACITFQMAKKLNILKKSTWAVFSLKLTSPDKPHKTPVQVAILPLDCFLRKVHPAQIIELLNTKRT